MVRSTYTVASEAKEAYWASILHTNHSLRVFSD